MKLPKASIPKPPASKKDAPFRELAFKPGGLSVPRSVIRKAVIETIKARLEREWVAP